MGSDHRLLGAIGIFSSLSAAELGILARRMRRRTFAAGESVFREGEEGEELFVLASGLVAVTLRTQDGEEVELSRVAAGGFFGEMSLLERTPRSASCTALEDTECMVLAAADFDALTAEHPALAVAVLRQMLGIAAGRLLKTGAFLSQMVRWGDSARRRAITDAATGLFNRRYLEDAFGPMVAAAKREGTHLAFAMFDLDRFGRLNAEHGAEFCDHLIVVASEAFRRVFSEEDILVRYGGDEFCFILPRPPAEALERCEALCAEIRALRFPEKPGLSISCSIGVASGTDTLKERADQALYRAKETGRDRAAAWTPAEGPQKKNLPSVAEKNRIIGRIVEALDGRDSFLVIGHADPDEDCLSSMVAFALLAGKCNKKAAIALGAETPENYQYLVNICRYNSIAIIRDGPLPPCSALVLVDTPKPSMVDRPERYAVLKEDPAVLKIELDHHLEADSRYFGDEGYRLVYEASSTCEIIGLLAMKMGNDEELMAKYQIQDLLSRNLVLAILSGMIGDSRMGRYLKTHRERWFYGRFSALFERILAGKTEDGRGNFSSKEQVFRALEALSNSEEACFRFIADRAAGPGKIRYAALDAETSRELFSRFGIDTVVAVARAVVDRLAEESGFLGLVGYYDDPEHSSFVQFRLRRSQAFTSLDLRDAIARLGMTNGGGHPGAVGFRLERELLPDIRAAAAAYAGALEAMVEETLGAGGYRT